MTDLFPEVNITDPGSAMTQASNNTNGAFPLGFAITMAAIVFITGIYKEWKLSLNFTVSMFVFTILAALMSYGKWINPIFALAGIILTGLGAIWLFTDK